MMEHACGPCFELVRKTGSEARRPDEPRVVCCTVGRNGSGFCVTWPRTGSLPGKDSAKLARYFTLRLHNRWECETSNIS